MADASPPKPSPPPHDPGLQGWSRDPNSRRWVPSPLAVVERRLQARPRAGAQGPAPTLSARLRLGADTRQGLARWLLRPRAKASSAPRDRQPGGSWWQWAPGPDSPLSQRVRIYAPILPPAEAPPEAPLAREGRHNEEKSAPDPLGNQALRGALMGRWSAGTGQQEPPSTALAFLRRFGPLKLASHLRSVASTLSPSPLIWRDLPRATSPQASSSLLSSSPVSPPPWADAPLNPKGCVDLWARRAFPSSTSPPGLPELALSRDTIEGATGPLRAAERPDPSKGGNPFPPSPNLEFEDRQPIKLPRREPALGRFLMRLRGASVEGVAEEARGAISLSIRAMKPGSEADAPPSPCPGLGEERGLLDGMELPALDLPPGPSWPFDQVTLPGGDLPAWALPRTQREAAKLWERGPGELPLRGAMLPLEEVFADMKRRLNAGDTAPKALATHGLVEAFRADLKALGWSALPPIEEPK